MNWSHLPSDLLETHIWPLLPFSDFLSSALACTQWYRASSRLYRLKLSGSPISTSPGPKGSFKAFISRFSYLAEVSFSGVPYIVPDTLQALSSSSRSSIVSISISWCPRVRLVGEVWPFAEWFPNLRRLDLRGCEVSSTACNPKTFPRTLTSLSLSSCRNIVDASLANISESVTQLLHLDIRGVHRVTNQGIGKMFKANTSLTSLDVSSLMRLTDASARDLASCCPSLVTLTARGLNWTNSALLAIAEACPALENVSLKMCPRLTDAGLVAFLPFLPRIRHLDLQKASLLPSSPILQSLSEHCPQLEHLDLRDCVLWVLDDLQLQHFLTACFRLQFLYLRSPMVTNSHLEVIASFTTNLEGLYLQECVSLTTDGILRLLGLISPQCLPLLRRLVLTDIPHLDHGKIDEKLAECSSVLVSHQNASLTHQLAAPSLSPP